MIVRSKGRILILRKMVKEKEKRKGRWKGKKCKFDEGEAIKGPSANPVVYPEEAAAGFLAAAGLEGGQCAGQQPL